MQDLEARHLERALFAKLEALDQVAMNPLPPLARVPVRRCVRSQHGFLQFAQPEKESRYQPTRESLEY